MKVFQAINAVQSDLSQVGIGKNRKNSQGAGYMFRGIDDVYQALSPLLAKHGLCIIPRMLTRTCEERQSKAGGALFYVTVEAEFDFVSAEDGSKATARTFGEAMDSGDKATNKAMSAAYKYAAFQTFAIPTEGNPDADAETHQVERQPQVISATAEAWKALDEDTQRNLRKIAVDVTGAMPDAAAALDILAFADLHNDLKAGLWHLLDSATRSALKKAQLEATA
jgi:hypothetical protein